ncbi:hypothetical protein EMEDMD4_1140016 [Sinorhizobium medicae]|uniref:Uncharacterized protein n=1 Tax=Sinorhizobium medicae TaxID=110321 RepID=A0A508WQ00_9HYPH|nr:hypothetical protein EMEDMD4_1140016 [Sinorhizobium medicae]
MAKQVFVRLSFVLALGTEAACHATGMDIGSKEEGDIHRWEWPSFLREAMGRHKTRCTGADRRCQDGASRKLAALAHSWLADRGNLSVGRHLTPEWQ